MNHPRDAQRPSRGPSAHGNPSVFSNRPGTMISNLRLSKAVVICALPISATGCSHSPSFNVLGSYFPGWIACIVAGIFVTALIRFIIRRYDWEQNLPALPLFYFSLALLVACAVWLIAFE